MVGSLNMMANEKITIDNGFDVERIRADFPILSKKIRGKDLVWLDSASSAQKPLSVIEDMDKVYREFYANVHRGVYKFSQETTILVESSRATVAKFLNSNSDKEIIFTRNATEAINLVASSWGNKFLKSGDEVIISSLEHHANIVPWHFLRENLGIEIKVIPLLENGDLDMDAYKSMLSDKVKMVACTQMSNAIGTIVDVKEIISLAKEHGAKTLIDGSQAVVHLDVDVSDLDCDFYVFTGHKLYGPSGVGVLYGKFDILNSMPPYQGGGEMIETVAFDKITYKEAPYRFEAGTPAIVEIIGLKSAIEYMNGFCKKDIREHEDYLLNLAITEMAKIDGVNIIANPSNRAGLVSFTIDNIHPHDIATIFDQMGIAVRAGQHCAEPLLNLLGVKATVRASFGIYNNKQDVDALITAIHKTIKIFG